MIDFVMVGLLVVAIALGIINLLRRPKIDTKMLEKYLQQELRANRQETNTALSQALRANSSLQAETQNQIAEMQDVRLKELTAQLMQSQAVMQRMMNDQSIQSEQKLENIRRTMEERMHQMQQGNEKKLDEMRHVVDEKLQKTLNERLRQSFSLVNDRLEQVYKGLGEMQTLAAGVGDLKKVLSNVKTRGILGEIQLGAILEELLAPEQYAANIATVSGSNERVEYAVKLPGDGEGESVWLPIDAKFPADAYANLLDAYDTGDAQAVDAASKILDNRIRSFAKDIRDKYIHVPETTDFGIMFLPVEGLYAEVVRRGLLNRLQTEYKVNIAGPTTMAALLNSLQMGFRTLAIQKRSSEVWKVLGDVKSEFGKFEDVLMKTKQHLELASRDIDDLVGVRTRQIRRKLDGVTSLSGIEEKNSDSF